MEPCSLSYVRYLGVSGGADVRVPPFLPRLRAPHLVKGVHGQTILELAHGAAQTLQLGQILLRSCHLNVS